MNGKEKAASGAAVTLLLLSSILAGGGAEKIDFEEKINISRNSMNAEISLKPSTPAAFIVVVKGGQTLHEADINGLDLGDYLSRVTIMEGRISGIQYGHGDEMHEMNMELYEKLKEKFGVGTVIYVFPPVKNEKLIGKERYVLNMKAKNGSAFEFYVVSEGAIQKLGGN